MNYQETVTYLFDVTPYFGDLGKDAYKPGLERISKMATTLGNVHTQFATIHVAGTNGKGSTSSTLAAMLSEEGYQTGLFTSPHLFDFRERIRINGIRISEQEVIDFVAKVQPYVEQWQPSFFELTTLMAFDHFARHKVDIAVIEVGMGGRLDSTNIITPLLSIITNVSLDHTEFLGHTLEKIANEKAGIIKPHVPVVIGEAEHPEVAEVFKAKALKEKAPIVFAQNEAEVLSISKKGFGLSIETKQYGVLYGELGGKAQHQNIKTILAAVALLNTHTSYTLSPRSVAAGLAHVVEKTGLRGRGELLGTTQHGARILCDTAHNTAGVATVVAQLQEENYHRLHIVWGMASDKDIDGILSLLPREAEYYFCAPKTKRALPQDELQRKASAHNLHGNTYESVHSAVMQAIEQAGAEDLIYIGGSNFVVAEVPSEIIQVEKD